MDNRKLEYELFGPPTTTLSVSPGPGRTGATEVQYRPLPDGTDHSPNEVACHSVDLGFRPIANRLVAPRTYITPSDNAGVAINNSPIELVER